MPKLYTSKGKEAIERIINTEHVDLKELECKIVSDAYVLPCKPAKSYGANIVYAGGVSTKNGSFLAGLFRHAKNKTLNYSVTTSYPVKESESLESAIFGGVIIDIFGHTITETISRLWFVHKQLYADLPILFVNTGQSVPPHFNVILDLLGISERTIVLTNPVLVHTLYIPEQSIILFSTLYKDYFASIYQEMKLHAENKDLGKKLYLTRSHFTRKDCLGEPLFEEIYQNNGYQIVALEEYSLSEQISIIDHAEELAMTIGTLSHMAILFCKNTAKLTFLLRENEPSALTPQLILNKLKDCEISIIDATYNFLPTTHARGIFLLYPNENFEDYAEAEKLEYDHEHIRASVSRFIPEYLTQYATNYSCYCYAYKRLRDLDFFDIVQRMSQVVLKKNIIRKNFHTESKVSLKNSLRLTETILGAPNILAFDQCQEGKRKQSLVKIGITEDAILFSGHKIPLGPAKEAVSDVFPKFNDTMLEILPILYTGLYLAETDADFFYFESAKPALAIKEWELSKIISSNLDCVFHRATFAQALDSQYISCHGSKSWQAVTKLIARDPYLDAVAKHSGYAQHYVFDKNFGCIRKNIFLQFFSWYYASISMLSDDESTLPYLQEISERLITLYFYAHSFKNICIAYYPGGC
ncbi:MAG: glycosyltransferase family 61 protein [Desulfovibrio sp.]|nr:glycosyltransferase family 61 protein [Desulfovibrio sp.]